MSPLAIGEVFGDDAPHIRRKVQRFPALQSHPAPAEVIREDLIRRAPLACLGGKVDYMDI